MKEPPQPSVTLNVRVTPRAKCNALTKTNDGNIKVYVTAPPEDGRANAAVAELIADWLGIKRRQVEIVGGLTNRNKVLRIGGVTRSQVEAASGLLR